MVFLDSVPSMLITASSDSSLLLCAILIAKDPLVLVLLREALPSAFSVTIPLIVFFATSLSRYCVISSAVGRLSGFGSQQRSRRSAIACNEQSNA